MLGIARLSAKKGRLRPSFFFWLCLAGEAWAQQPVYRCGQEYTNAPQDVSRCEHMVPQAVTVIPGTRVQGAQTSTHSVPTPMPMPSSPAAVNVPQSQRDGMARSILDTELAQARQRHTQLLHEYQQGEPTRTPTEMNHPQQYQERVARLKAAVERSQRDIDSLQRELTRHPPVTATP